MEKEEKYFSRFWLLQTKIEMKGEQDALVLSIFKYWLKKIANSELFC